MSTTGFAPHDEAFVADPYPAYAQLRLQTPTWDAAADMWLLARHADVDAALRDRRMGRTFDPLQPEEQFGPWNLLNTHSMLEMEPPDHTRLRGLVAREFTARRVEALRPRVRALVAELLDDLDDMDDAGEADLIAALAEPLPVGVIAELLGVPAADRRLLRPWSNAIVGLYEPALQDGAAQRAVEAAAEFGAYLRDLIARRREDPTDDLLSALAARREAEALSTDELVATAALLLNAGHEASVNALGNGVVALLRAPEQRRRLDDDPSLARHATEEMLRFDTPLSLFTRTVREPVELHGRQLEPGATVGLLLGAANRDEDVFADADRFVVDRSPNPHVAFGGGIHFCLGAPLARLELTEALTGLLGRFPGLDFATEPPRRTSYQFRGYAAVPVTLR